MAAVAQSDTGRLLEIRPVFFICMCRTHASAALDVHSCWSPQFVPSLSLPELRAPDRLTPLRFPLISESATRLIVPALAPQVTSVTMVVSPMVTLSDTEKLEALRGLDQFRQWRSLEDKRYCLVCGNIITGRQIQVWSGTGAISRLQVNCPTEGCNSIAMDWVLPTDEILEKVEQMAGEQSRNASPPLPAAAVLQGSAFPEKQQDNGFASSWRKLGLLFKHSS